jgi:16S rRNA (guanine966-N2)-methyltransferase
MGATRQRAGRPARRGHDRSHERGAQARRLRIIAGRWRGRRWQFPEGDIRPTGDRVRETLFNWLQDRISGRRCLDLYAGSGALGLEALSRGVAHCTFVDNDARAIGAIGELLRKWGAAAGSAQLEPCSAAQFLARPPQPMDLVFLDPPFADGVLAATAAQLEARGWLAPGCLVYLEHPRAVPLSGLPAGWQPLRSGTAGAVGYDLYVRH